MPLQKTTPPAKRAQKKGLSSLFRRVMSIASPKEITYDTMQAAFANPEQAKVGDIRKFLSFFLDKKDVSLVTEYLKQDDPVRVDLSRKILPVVRSCLPKKGSLSKDKVLHNPEAVRGFNHFFGPKLVENWGIKLPPQPTNQSSQFRSMP